MKEVIQTDAAPAAVGPYSQGIKAGNYVFVSGQLPLDPGTGLFPDGIKAQTAQSIKNVQAVLRAAGTDLNKVVKSTVFLTDINDFAAVNEVYAQFFNENPPSRSAVQIVALPKGANIEIEVIASL